MEFAVQDEFIDNWGWQVTEYKKGGGDREMKIRSPIGKG